MCAKKHIFILTVLVIFSQVDSLVELPVVEDNDIVRAEAVTRKTINSLFSLLRLTKIRDKPKLKQFSVVHDFFVTLTLQDYNSLTKIAQLTRVDKADIENVTADFMALLNEILKEDNLAKLQDLVDGKSIEGAYDMDNEIQKIELLKNDLVDADRILDINVKILNLLEKQEEEEEENAFNNQTTAIKDHNMESDEIILEEDAFWKDEHSASGRRIFKGHRTKIKRFPFMVSVQIFNKFQCGGSLIASDLVITACSCLQLAWNNRFYRENPQFLSVRVGSSFYESGGDNIGVLEVYFHPTYNPKTLHNNLAVMRLHRRVKWASRVKKIKLDQNDYPLPYITDRITVVGWGARSSTNVLHGPWLDKLGYAYLDIYPIQDCQDIYSKEYVTEHNFCAGFISIGGGACNRDVGGPGVVDGVLVGVISFGAPVCGTPDAPTVFTKLGYYYDWLEDILEHEVPYKKQRTTPKPTQYTYPAPEDYTPHSSNDWTVTPLPVDPYTRRTLPTFTTTTETSKNLRHLDKQLFKDFLKTMFDSDEIEEYLDTVRGSTPAKAGEPAGNGSQQDMVYTPMLTRMIGDMDPITTPVSDENDSEDSRIEGLVVGLGPSPTRMILDPSDAPDWSEPPMVTVQPLITQALNDVLVQELDIEKKLFELTPTSEIPSIQTVKLSSVANVEPHLKPIDKLDDAILTLLYLTDNETETGKRLNTTLVPGEVNSGVITEEDKMDNQNLPLDFSDSEEPKDLTYRHKKNILGDESFIDLLSQAFYSAGQGGTEPPKESVKYTIL